MDNLHVSRYLRLVICRLVVCSSTHGHCHGDSSVESHAVAFGRRLASLGPFGGWSPSRSYSG